MLLRSILLTVLLCAGAAAQSQYPRLALEWEKIIGPPGGTPWLAAVCPDGLVYAANVRGRAVAVNARGVIQAESDSVPALLGARALACDGNGRLYAARGGYLTVLRVAHKSFETVREVRPEVVITAMAIGAKGRIFAAGRASGSRLPLHIVEPDGRLVRSFGDNGRPYPSLRPQSLLLWQRRPERLLVVTSQPYRIDAYAPDGALLDSVEPRFRSLIRPAQLLPGSDVPGAAALPGGQTLVQFPNFGPLRTDRPGTVLDLLDKKFRVLASDIPAFAGTLAGASSSGDLYFLGTNRRPSLIKASLDQGPAVTRVLAWNYELFRVFLCCPVRDRRTGFGKISG